MNILITGANGYLAKKLIKELASKTKHNLTLLVRKNSNVNDLQRYVNNDGIIFYDGSIESLKFLKQFKIDIVFHLANYYPDIKRLHDPVEIIGSNFLLIANIISTLENTNNYRIINIGSYITVGHQNSLYGITKQAAQNYISIIGGENYILYDTYGANDPRSKLINSLIYHSKTKEKLKMKKSKNSQIKLIYIKDVISAFMLAIEKQQQSICKISTETLTLKEVIDTFNNISKQEVNVEWPEDKVNQYILPEIDQNIKGVEGWKPRYNLVTGLTELLRS